MLKKIANIFRKLVGSSESAHDIALFAPQNPSPILRISSEGVLIYHNDSAALLVDKWGVRIGKKIPEEWLRFAQDVLSEDESRSVEISVDSVIYSLAFVPIAKERYVNIYASDVTQRVENEHNIMAMKNLDDLTGLPTKVLFDSLIDELRVLQGDEKIAFVVIGVSRFDEVMHALGRNATRQLMKTFAMRLQSALPEQSVLCALSFNTYCFAISDSKQVANVDLLVEDVSANISGNYAIDHMHVNVSVNAGVVIHEEGDLALTRLIEQANLALYHARSHNLPCQFYAEKIDAKIKERHQLLLDLRRALVEDQFEVYYQPQYNIASGKLCGAEALVRWQHPKRGWVSPIDFVPLAEQTGLIVPIGEWIMKAACVQSRLIQEECSAAVPIAVNVSAAQFHGEGFVATLMDIMRETKMPANLLEIELTESMFMTDVESAIAIMHEVRKLGVGLSIDDFGTGYSSLNYLKQFPVNKLKIDKSFIDELEVIGDRCAIVSTIIQLGQNLNLKVIAEGIETQHQLDILTKEKCDEVQGYLFSKPLSFEEFKALVSSK